MDKETALKEAAKVGHALDNVLRSEDGRTVMTHLFRICGYNRSSVVVNPQTGDIKVDGTVYNEARRAVYLQLRRMASPVLLAPVEEAAELADASVFEKKKIEEGEIK